jgi:hypothetical protein
MVKDWRKAMVAVAAVATVLVLFGGSAAATWTTWRGARTFAHHETLHLTAPQGAF